MFNQIQVDRELVGASINEALNNCLARNADFSSGIIGQTNLIDDFGNNLNGVLQNASSMVSSAASDELPPLSCSPVPSSVSPVQVS